MKRRPRPRKYITLMALLFLLLGAIVNVAVAWGCAWRAKFVWNEWPLDIGRMSLDPHTVTFVERRRFGCTRITANFWPSADFPVPRSFPPGSPPYWTMRTLMMNGDAGDGMPIDASGIPFRIASCHWKDNWKLYDGLPLSSDQFSWVHKGRSALPTNVIWPGFAINTIFYAAVLWVLFALPGAYRRHRRIKRGQCPACAYPVGQSDVCTECGGPVAPGRINLP